MWKRFLRKTQNNGILHSTVIPNFELLGCRDRIGHDNRSRNQPTTSFIKTVKVAAEKSKITVFYLYRYFNIFSIICCRAFFKYYQISTKSSAVGTVSEKMSKDSQVTVNSDKLQATYIQKVQQLIRHFQSYRTYFRNNNRSQSVRKPKSQSTLTPFKDDKKNNIF